MSVPIHLDDRIRGGLIGRALFGEATPWPTTVGRFRIEGRLGAGGSGSVYRAYDPELQRFVALEVVRDQDAGEHERARHEARALARIRAQHVVQVHEVGTTDGQTYIVLELIDGQSLRAWARTRPPVAQCLRVIAGIASGLEAIHAAGVVHRDIKPDNVVVDAEGRASIIDFGLATDPSADEALGGTPGYLAPELFEGAAPSVASDIYALCRVADELLTGSDRARVRRRIRRTIERGLLPDPAARPASAAEIRRAITASRGWAGPAGVLAVAGLAVALALGPLEKKTPAHAIEGRPVTDSVCAMTRTHTKAPIFPLIASLLGCASADVAEPGASSKRSEATPAACVAALGDDPPRPGTAKNLRELLWAIDVDDPERGMVQFQLARAELSEGRVPEGCGALGLALDRELGADEEAAEVLHVACCPEGGTPPEIDASVTGCTADDPTQACDTMREPVCCANAAVTDLIESRSAQTPSARKEATERARLRLGIACEHGTQVACEQLESLGD